MHDKRLGNQNLNVLQSSRGNRFTDVTPTDSLLDIVDVVSSLKRPFHFLRSTSTLPRDDPKDRKSNSVVTNVHGVPHGLGILTTYLERQPTFQRQTGKTHTLLLQQYAVVA